MPPASGGVAQAWQLKEALRTWYRTTTPATAAALLAQWGQEIRDSGLAEFWPPPLADWGGGVRNG